MKGHSGDPMNDLVDRLAVEASVTQAGRVGEGEPVDLGPADLPRGAKASATGRDRRLPSGRLVLVGGHRPDALGGYGDNPRPGGCARGWGRSWPTMVEVDGPLTVVERSAAAGPSELGAEAALERGLPLVAVLPFPNPDGAVAGRASDPLR